MDKLTDKDFAICESETDIRELSRKNKDQINIRIENTKIAYLKAIQENQIDIMRLLMVALKKLGAEDITSEIEKIIGGDK